MATVLVLDDVVENASLAADYLRQCGHDVFEAHTGREALSLVTFAQFDVLVIDLHLPDMNGVDLIGTLRRDTDPRVARVPIIAATAFAMASDRQRCLDAGANDYLPRPFRLKDLNERVCQLLNSPA